MTREELRKNTISYCVNIKYLDYDDIQWDILGMSSNKQEPLSLRILKGEYKNGCC